MRGVSRDYSDKRAVGRAIAVIIGIILILLIASWLMTRGIEDNRAEEPTPGAIPANPDTPGTGSGGNTGVGTGTNNDPNESTPTSPAGGTDTNQVPSGTTIPE